MVKSGVSILKPFFFNLLNDIKLFPEKKDELNDIWRITDLAFPVDVTDHLNNLGRLLCKDNSLLSCKTTVRHESEASTVRKPTKHA